MIFLQQLSLKISEIHTNLVTFTVVFDPHLFQPRSNHPLSGHKKRSWAYDAVQCSLTAFGRPFCVVEP